MYVAFSNNAIFGQLVVIWEMEESAYHCGNIKLSCCVVFCNCGKSEQK